MEVYVLNKDFYPIYSIDSYESLLWTGEIRPVLGL